MARSSDDFPEWLMQARAMGVARLRGDGRIIRANDGFQHYVGEASWLLEPDLDALEDRGREHSYAGEIVLGDLEGGEFSILGKLYRDGKGWLLVNESEPHAVEELRGEISRLRERMEEMSRHDDLTGLATRGELDYRLEFEAKRWERYHRPLSLVLLDMDYFAAVNDRYGQEAADEALVHVATVLRQSIRSPDLAARYDGEGFALLLPETNDMGAMIVAERLQFDLESQILLPLVEPLTASFGVAMMRQGEKSGAFFLRAARAVQESKEKGRNCVTIAH